MANERFQKYKVNNKKIHKICKNRRVPEIAEMHVRNRNVRTSFSISQSVNDAHSKLMMAALTEETLVYENNMILKHKADRER